MLRRLLLAQAARVSEIDLDPCSKIQGGLQVVKNGVVVCSAPGRNCGLPVRQGRFAPAHAREAYRCQDTRRTRQGEAHATKLFIGAVFSQCWVVGHWLLRNIVSQQQVSGRILQPSTGGSDWLTTNGWKENRSRDHTCSQSTEGKQTEGKKRARCGKSHFPERNGFGVWNAHHSALKHGDCRHQWPWLRTVTMCVECSFSGSVARPVYCEARGTNRHQLKHEVRQG